jgi:hypothetical protein
MKRIQRGPVRGISLKLQEEEREKRMDFVPEVSAIYQETIEVDEDTLQMIKAAGFDKISNVQVRVFRAFVLLIHIALRGTAGLPEEGYGETGRLPAPAGGRQQVHVPVCRSRRPRPRVVLASTVAAPADRPGCVKLKLYAPRMKICHLKPGGGKSGTSKNASQEARRRRRRSREAPSAAGSRRRVIFYHGGSPHLPR